jgi:6-pyruvoyl-tetrahydropterin synthase
MNLSDLKTLIRELVIEQVDHANLNHDVPFMQGKLASTEVLAEEIWKVLNPAIAQHGCNLHRIRLEETENNAVEFFG